MHFYNYILLCYFYNFHKPYVKHFVTENTDLDIYI